MGTGSFELHEDGLPAAVVNRHRAIVSIMEELEAVDWYDQRVAATEDPALAEVLAHNRDEEKEHAAMTLEWLRRRDPALDRQLRKFLFTTTEPITEVVTPGGGATADGDGRPAPGAPGSLGIGSLKGVER
jgi:uncharacterized protein